MHNPVTAAISPLAILILLHLAGCAEPPVQEYPAEKLPPELLKVPTWEIGDYWNYYRPEEERWENFTVQSVEAVDEYSTYRVYVEISPPDEFGLREELTWIDIQTLGDVMSRNAMSTVKSDPPIGQIFPLQNRTYTPLFETSGGYSDNSTLRVSIVGWSSLRIDDARYDVVEYALFYDDFDEEIHRAWYSPAARNVVKTEVYGDERILKSWGSA